MNVLALFAGYGGIELGLDLAGKVCGFVPRTVCYVEIEAFAVANLAKKMAEGFVDEAPIWSDVTTFDGQPWRGKVDCITAGVPCQPASQIGKRLGAKDERWLWPHLWRLLDEIRPALAYMENPTGIVREGWGDILGALAARGYTVEWDRFTANALGGDHVRERIFALAASPDACGNGLERIKPSWTATGTVGRNSWRGSNAGRCRRDNGTPYRVDRIEALGNGVVPIVAGYAFVTLAKRIGLKISEAAL